MSKHQTPVAKRSRKIPKSLNAFHSAIIEANYKQIMSLFEKSLVNEHIDGYTPLFCLALFSKTASTKQNHIIQFLIQKGAKVDIRPLTEFPAIYHLAYLHNFTGVQLLLAAGAKVEIETKVTPQQAKFLSKSEEVITMVKTLTEVSIFKQKPNISTLVLEYSNTFTK